MLAGKQKDEKTKGGIRMKVKGSITVFLLITGTVYLNIALSLIDVARYNSAKIASEVYFKSLIGSYETTADTESFERYGFLFGNPDVKNSIENQIKSAAVLNTGFGTTCENKEISFRNHTFYTDNSQDDANFIENTFQNNIIYNSIPELGLEDHYLDVLASAEKIESSSEEYSEYKEAINELIASGSFSTEENMDRLSEYGYWDINSVPDLSDAPSGKFKKALENDGIFLPENPDNIISYDPMTITKSCGEAFCRLDLSQEDYTRTQNAQIFSLIDAEGTYYTDIGECEDYEELEYLPALFNEYAAVGGDEDSDIEENTLCKIFQYRFTADLVSLVRYPEIYESDTIEFDEEQRSSYIMQLAADEALFDTVMLVSGKPVPLIKEADEIFAAEPKTDNAIAAAANYLDYSDSETIADYRDYIRFFVLHTYSSSDVVMRCADIICAREGGWADLNTIASVEISTKVSFTPVSLYGKLLAARPAKTSTYCICYELEPIYYLP